MSAAPLLVPTVFSPPASPRSGGWTPSQILNQIRIWFDAEALATLTLGSGLVNSWADNSGKTGMAVKSATTVGFMPTWQANALNGRPAIVFDGVDDYLVQGTWSGGFSLSDANFDMWALVSQDDAAVTATRDIVRVGNLTSTRARLGKTPVTSVNRGRTLCGNGTTELNVNNGSVIFNGVNLIRGKIRPNSVSVSVNGGSDTTSNFTTSIQDGQLLIGSLNSSSGYFTGKINSILITNPLSGRDEENLIGFLKARGGIP